MANKNFALAIDMMCPNCGDIQVIYHKTDNRRDSRLPALWCPNCKKEYNFINIKDRDITYFNLLYKDKKTNIEQFIFNNLESRRNNGKSKQLGIRK